MSIDYTKYLDGNALKAVKRYVDGIASNKLDKNVAITAVTEYSLLKIKYDSKGLIVGSVAVTSNDIPDLPASKITTGTLNVARIPDLSSIYQTVLSSYTAYTNVGSASKIPVISTNSLGQVTSITTVDIVSANDATVTINGGPNVNPFIFTLNQAQNASITIDRTFIGLSDVENYGQTSAYTSGSNLYFTSNGAYLLRQELLTEIRTQSAHYRGEFSTWANVPTSDSDYKQDPDGSKTPTANDYMIVDDASGYPVTSPDPALVGTWRFIYTGVWGTSGKSGWEPAYAIDAELTGILDSLADLPANETGLVKLSNGVASLDKTSYVVANASITGASKCKITYDSKGLVTGGADLAASDIPALPTSKITSGTFADARIASAAAWNAKYDKPAGGIPAGDLAESYYLASNPNGYTANVGTVTSVRVQAGTGLVSSQNTAQSATLNTTISIDPNYKLPTMIEWNAKANLLDLGTQVTFTYSDGVLTITPLS